MRANALLLLPMLALGPAVACGSKFNANENGGGEAGEPASGGGTKGARGGNGGSAAIGDGGDQAGGDESGGSAGSGARASGGTTSGGSSAGGSDSGGANAGGSVATGGDAGNLTGGTGTGGGAGTGSGGSPTGGTGNAGSGGSAGGVTYVDAQLISSCSGPRGETFDGAWYAGAGGASSFSPAHTDGMFPMTAGGYMGSAARIWGTMANADYAYVGLNMYSGAALFNASAYAGISFYAKAASPIYVRVGLGQQNNEPTYGVCTPDVTCYKYPEIRISVGTTWTRYVAVFSQMQTDPPGIVPTTPSTMKHIQFSMEAGVYDFYVDELYFVTPR